MKYYLIGVGRVLRLMTFLVPLLCLGTELSGVPYQGTLVLEGKITFGSQMPPDEQFLVDLQSEQGISIRTTLTRESSNFRFTNIPGGVYYILVKVEGFREHRQLVDVAGRTFVDVAMLARRYPEEAVEEYEKSVGPVDSALREAVRRVHALPCRSCV